MKNDIDQVTIGKLFRLSHPQISGSGGRILLMQLTRLPLLLETSMKTVLL
jgi:hypothetical protein